MADGVTYKFVDQGRVEPISVTSRWTGEVVRGNSYEELRCAYKDHHRLKGIHLPPEWKQQFETDLCAENEWHGTRCERDMSGKTWPGVLDLLRFSQMFLGWVRTGLQPVPKDKAEARAATCASCPENVEYVHGCFGCRSTAPVIAEAVRRLGHSPTTSLDPQLHTCRACGCVLKLKVHVPSQFLKDEHVDYPDHCWRRTE